MVRLRGRAVRAGHRGKLTSDPALVDTAAVALLYSLDPIWLTGLHPEEFAFTVAALNRAQEMTRENDKNRADYLSGKTAGLTARSITRWLSRALRSK